MAYHLKRFSSLDLEMKENHHSHLFYCLSLKKIVPTVNVGAVITVLFCNPYERTSYFTRQRWDLHLKCVLGLKNIQLWGMEMGEKQYMNIPADLKTYNEITPL